MKLRWYIYGFFAVLLGLGCDAEAESAPTRRLRVIDDAPAPTEPPAPRAVARAPVPEPTPEAATLAAAAVEPPASAVTREAFEMTFVGDVIFGRYRDDGFDPIPGEGQEIFAEVGGLLRSDLLVGNLETPLVHELPAASPVGTRYSFGADESLAQQLVQGGFGAMSLANNHAYDLRGEGIEQTPRILRGLGIEPLGAAVAEPQGVRVETVERRGWRVGFLAVTTQSNIDGLEGLPPLPLVPLSDLAAQVVPQVEDARASHDLVVVLVHWGDEYAEEPAWEQRQAAHALVQAGADLVIGHHPHVLQGIERYGHGLIAYSLGNFVFENVKEIPRQTGVLRTRFDARGCLSAVTLHPAFVKSVPFKHPAPAVGFLGGKIKARVRAQGQPLGTRWADEGDSLGLEGLRCPGAPGPRPARAAP